MGNTIKINGVEYDENEEVEVYKGADGYFHIVESLENLQDKEYSKVEEEELTR